MTLPELIDANISAYEHKHGMKPSHVFVPARYDLPYVCENVRGVKIVQLFESDEMYVLAGMCENFVKN